MERIKLHTQTPHQKHLKEIAEEIKKGAVVIIPTDSTYAMACTLSSKRSIERIIKITGKKEKKARMSLLCKDISTISGFTMPINNHIFKTMKRYTPGPYTFILTANNYTQKLFKGSKKEIGVRIVGTEILQQLHAYLDEPLISTTLNMKDSEEHTYIDPDLIAEDFKYDVDILVDGGLGRVAESTVLDCREDEIELIRMGEGPVD
jgi:tRNA threonylcarbamoyl adenosine modification protein (Sua5/YciO/YrdC/YwlC family)